MVDGPPPGKDAHCPIILIGMEGTLPKLPQISSLVSLPVSTKYPESDKLPPLIIPDLNTSPEALCVEISQSPVIADGVNLASKAIAA